MENCNIHYNILFLNRDFYQYDIAIEKKLSDLGNTVFSYSIKPNASIIARMVVRVCQKFGDYLAKRQQRKILKDLIRKKIKIDIVFVVAGQQLATDTLRKMKKMYPVAKFVWYMWDNVANLKEFAKNKDFFDNIISFDWHDAEIYNVDFLPLFYTVTKREQERIYDLNFIGEAHSNRKEILSRILQGERCIEPFIYLLVGRYTLLKYTLFKRKDILTKYMRLKPLPYGKVIDSFAKSKCIVDFPHPKQTGLTMRTFEAMGTGTKLITTNPCVKQYDFYNPDNIYVLDSRTLQMPDNAFFQKPYQSLEKEIFKKYSIDTWISTITSYFNNMIG